MTISDGHDYRKHARVHLYTGDGEGKTTTALGLALRALGHNHRVAVVQFLKSNKKGGEFKIMRKLAPRYEIYQFGREGTAHLSRPENIDYVLADEGVKFTEKILKRTNNKPRLLVLDEINLAVALGLIKANRVINLINKATPDMTVILTGRRAPKKIVKCADLITNMRMIKHPYRGMRGAVDGAEY